MAPSGDLAVVIPARNETARIGATVTAAMLIPGVDIVVVVDDGSADDTSRTAKAAGATVVRHARSMGKAKAMETGAEMVALIEADSKVASKAILEPQVTAHWLAEPGLAGQVMTEARAQTETAQAALADPSLTASLISGAAPAGPGAPGAGDGGGGDGPRGEPRHLLFLDADLAATAARAGPLAEPVRAGQADMTIAVFSQRVRHGGHGLVRGLAGSGIERATGWRPAEPLNGQRCLSRAAFEAARPLAPRFGAETGLTIDVLRHGMRIAEVQVPLAHRATGRDLKSQLHRARQLADVFWALAARHAWRRGEGGPARTPGGTDAGQRSAASGGS